MDTSAVLKTYKNRLCTPTKLFKAVSSLIYIKEFDSDQSGSAPAFDRSFDRVLSEVVNSFLKEEVGLSQISIDSFHEDHADLVTFLKKSQWTTAATRVENFITALKNAIYMAATEQAISVKYPTSSMRSRR